MPKKSGLGAALELPLIGRESLSVQESLREAAGLLGLGL
jgi:hypothetical protein